MIKFKEEGLEGEFYKLDPRAQRITKVLEAIMYARHGLHATVTSVYREDKNSPHHFYRAVDIRSRDLRESSCIFMEAILNIIFPYQAGVYKTVLYHNAGSGYHFHIQVKA